MRFACQSCGKAYNLPEEKIANKSNVKLKCRVCGAIVQVKKNGDVVASLLTAGATSAEGPPSTRVSEAPPPMVSGAPEALSLPPSAPRSASTPSVSLTGALPPLSESAGAANAGVPSASPPNSPLVSPAAAISGELTAQQSDEDDDATAPAPPVAPVAESVPAVPEEVQAFSAVALPTDATENAPGSGEGSPNVGASSSSDTGLKMLASFVTGVVLDRILVGLNFW